MTPQQQKAAILLKWFLRDLYENVHGSDSWKARHDEMVEDIVTSISNKEDIVPLIRHEVNAGPTRFK